MTEQYGRQEANKRVVFTKFPNVLKIHLKRFEYDKNTMALAKINDYFEFSEELNLDQYADTTGRNTYKLFSVLIHTGRLNAGHYFNYMSPKLDGRWFKYNDTIVSPVTKEQVFKGSFGGPEPDYTV